MNKPVDTLLKSVYYRGKDGVGYTDTEIKQDRLALYYLILEEIIGPNSDYDDFDMTDASNYHAQKLRAKQRTAARRVFGVEDE